MKTLLNCGDGSRAHAIFFGQMVEFHPQRVDVDMKHLGKDSALFYLMLFIIKCFLPGTLFYIL